MKPFICTVGLNCVDIVNFLPKYPLEDSDQRCTKQSWERGGNASNNASVMTILGADVEFYGTLANDHLLTFFQNDMKSYGIKCENCPVLNCVQSPTSVVICSEETGSRTIVHNNGNLPELTPAHFKEKIDLSLYDWIHFEGRNEAHLPEMLKYIQDYNVSHGASNTSQVADDEVIYTKRKLPVSIEVEKQRESLSILLPLADIVFVGKEFAAMKGAKDCKHAAQIFSQMLPKGILIICAWGEQGAAFCIAGQSADKIKHIQASPPKKIVDSLGAGDTFNAAVIFGLINNLDVETSVQFGCKVAGAKLGVIGFRNISEAIQHLPELKLFRK